MRTLVVFEDSVQRAFATLTEVRGVFDLRCGARTLLERLVGAVPADHVVLLPRRELTTLVEENNTALPGLQSLSSGASFAPGEVVFVNGRLLALGKDVQRLLAGAAAEYTGWVQGSLVLARCAPAGATKLAAALRDALDATTGGPRGATTREKVAAALPTAPMLELDARHDWNRDGSALLAHAWQLTERNGSALRDDFAQGPGAGIDPGARLDAGVHILQPDAVRIEAGARLRPGVVLDAEAGPITIAAGVEVQSHVLVRGPAYVGEGCLLKAGTKIQGNTSLGPVCKIGGEVEGSIVQGFSNKQHEGFLGHAFLAEWVNLGADTNTSDLKNNYGNVRMWEVGEFVDTGLMFAGLVAADHVKTAIDTQLNTGTVLGLASQIAMSGFPPKYIPPFSWCGPDGIEVYDLERALNTARTVMARRDRALTPAYEAAFRRAFAAHDRKS